MNEKIKLNLFYSMLRIRRVQERIESLYLQDQMKTPIHLCIGQEAIAVGACANLEKEDYITSNHRGHHHYLAKGGNLKALIAELHCKVDGCSKGFGGSMHLIDIDIGHLGSSSIVGGGIPIGTGLALSIKMKKQNRVSVIFFGDGAADEGVLYESINFAILKNLPAIYILENNQWSVCSHVSTRQYGDNIFLNADPKYLFTKKLDGNDVTSVDETIAQAVQRARNQEGPSFIVCDTYRITGHSGCFSQDPWGYRDPAEVRIWKQKCPVENYKQILLYDHILSESGLNVMENQIQKEINEAFKFAIESPLPDEELLCRYLYAE